MTSFLGAPIRVQRPGLRQPLPDRQDRGRRVHRRRRGGHRGAGRGRRHRRRERPAPPAGRRARRVRGPGPHGPGPPRRGHPAAVRHRAVAPGPVGQPGRPDVADGLAAAVADIDETIRQVRATIFELGGRAAAGASGPAWSALAEELRPVIGFDVPVEFNGPVDTAVSDAVADQLLPTLREALTNVGRHAGRHPGPGPPVDHRTPVPARDHRQRRGASSSGPPSAGGLGLAQHAQAGRGPRRHLRGGPARGRAGPRSSGRSRCSRTGVGPAPTADDRSRTGPIALGDLGIPP